MGRRPDVPFFLTDMSPSEVKTCCFIQRASTGPGCHVPFITPLYRSMTADGVYDDDDDCDYDYDYDGGKEAAASPLKSSDCEASKRQTQQGVRFSGVDESVEGEEEDGEEVKLREEDLDNMDKEVIQGIPTPSSLPPPPSLSLLSLSPSLSPSLSSLLSLSLSLSPSLFLSLYPLSLCPPPPPFSPSVLPVPPSSLSLSLSLSLCFHLFPSPSYYLTLFLFMSLSLQRSLSPLSFPSLSHFFSPLLSPRLCLAECGLDQPAWSFQCIITIVSFHSIAFPASLADKFHCVCAWMRR